MKRIWIVFVLTYCFRFQSFAEDSTIKQTLRKTDSIVWAGLDYSIMRVIGNTNTLKAPDLIFQDMPAKWNDLFMDERLELIANSMKKRFFIDVAAVTERNRSISTNQIILTSDFKKVFDDSHITPQDIANEVKGYKLEHSDGLGLTFIVDRIVSAESSRLVPGNTHSAQYMEITIHGEAVYVVFFDIATRQVISSIREVRYVNTGGSFRFFWFGPIKDIDSGLSKYLD